MDVKQSPIVLSHFQIRPLLRVFEEGVFEAESSADLNRTTEIVQLDQIGIHYQRGETLSWDDAAKIADSENKCYTLINGDVEEIRFFSETTNWSRSLMPTSGAPTMLGSRNRHASD